MPHTLWVALAITVAVAGSPYAQSHDVTLLPVDEAARAPDFLRFRNALRQTIAQRDVTGLLAIVDPRIKNSFGGNDGIEEFKKFWRVDQRDSEVWWRLDALLSLGGSFSGEDTFVAPYVFANWPDQFDGIDYWAVTGRNVRVRASPDADARVLRQVSFAILQRASEDGGGGQPWTEVRLPAGGTGYVSSRYLRSPIDYRAYFVRAGGRWMMTALLSGD